MKNSTLIQITFSLASILASIALILKFPLTSYLFLLILISTLLLSAVFYILNKLFKEYKLRYTKLLLIVLICLISLISLQLKPIQPAVPVTKDSDSQILSYIEETDQKDRYNILMILFDKLQIKSANSLKNRDHLRLAMVLQIIDTNHNLTAHDKLKAALLLQHGGSSEHYRLAHIFAYEALSENIEDADWLCKASFDRWQLSIGKPQVYDTQKFTN